MPEQVGDLVEQLRRLRWEMRISRDQLLKAAEGLPDSLLCRAQQTAEKLMGMHRKIEEMSEKLPADTEILVPEELSRNTASLCDDGALALRDLDGLINDLHDFFSETPISRTH